YQVRVHEQVAEERASRGSLLPLEPATDARTMALERRIQALTARVADLERELEEARSQMAVEVDLSHPSPPETPLPEDDPTELARRLRQDPRDDSALRSLYRLNRKRGDDDRAFTAAHALVFLGVAEAEERALFERLRSQSLIRPRASLSADAWRKLLMHPD